MNIRIYLLSLACLLFFPAFAFASDHGHHHHSSGEPSAAVYTVKGQVQSIDVENRRVNITHQAIAALGWPEMTMYFSVESPELLEGLKPAQEIRFDFQIVGNASVILDIDAEN